MGFFKRLFSSDYRSAVAAEAAGNLELAAERYALAGHADAAVRVHLSRAQRASDRQGEIDALRDALRWSTEGSQLHKLVSRRLGQALLAGVRAEGVATYHDHKRVREAAELLSSAGDHGTAGAALEEIGEHGLAVAAYRRGGMVDELERALRLEEEVQQRERDEREAFADYELHMSSGNRDAALTAIRKAVAAAESKSRYRVLQDELESRLITSGRAVLRVRAGREITLCTGPEVLLGRDPLCDLVLRSGGVSRRHANLVIDDGGDFFLEDAGSRNGTRLAGVPITERVALGEEGEFALGDECDIHYRLSGGSLKLDVTRGLDQGSVVHLAREGSEIDLDEPKIRVYFRDGRPILSRDRAGLRLYLNGERLAHGEVQLIHGDRLNLDGLDFEVA